MEHSSPVSKGGRRVGACCHPPKISPQTAVLPSFPWGVDPIPPRDSLLGLPQSQTILGGFKNILHTLLGADTARTPDWGHARTAGAASSPIWVPHPNGCDLHDNAASSSHLLPSFGSHRADGSGRSAAVSTACALLSPCILGGKRVVLCLLVYFLPTNPASSRCYP